MILYIPLEVKVRELPGYILLAVYAVSKGHQVLIASPSDLWLYVRLKILDKGVLIVKNINIPHNSKEMYEYFNRNNIDIYCQEQEPPILWDDLAKYLKKLNLKSDQYFPFKAVFCFGDKDRQGYINYFKKNNNYFVNSGSPRVDLWSYKYASKRKKNLIHSNYILVVSNYGYWMGKKHMSEFIKIERSLELLDTYEQEQNMIDFLHEDSKIFLEMVIAIKRLANEKKDIKIIIRPHPLDKKEYWENLYEKNENVVVIDADGSITPIIAGADMVIQNGCTTALEAVLQSIPVISYGPERNHSDMSIPNKLGIRAKNYEELNDAIKIIYEKKYDEYQIYSNNILKNILRSDGCAAERIINVIEEKSNDKIGGSISNKRLMAMRILRNMKDIIEIVRSVNKKQINRKANILKKNDIISEVIEVSTILNLRIPKISMIRDTGVLIY